MIRFHFIHIRNIWSYLILYYYKSWGMDGLENILVPFNYFNSIYLTLKIKGST